MPEELDKLKSEITRLSTGKLIALLGFLEGVLAGRQTATNLVVEKEAKAPRKRSACSLCHQSGHRKPNCPTTKVVAS